MLRHPAWQATDDLARTQFALYQTISEAVSLTEDDRKLALGLTEQDWHAWRDFVTDGPLPPQPPLPEMILRLGQAAYAASVVPELRGMAA